MMRARLPPPRPPLPVRARAGAPQEQEEESSRATANFPEASFARAASAKMRQLLLFPSNVLEGGSGSTEGEPVFFYYVK